MSDLIPLTFLAKVEVAFEDMKARIIAEMGETTHLHYAVQEAKESILTATAEHFPPMEDKKEDEMPSDAAPGIENPPV